MALSGRDILEIIPEFGLISDDELREKSLQVWADELKKYESEVLTATERSKTLEAQLYETVRERLTEHIPPFQAAAEARADAVYHAYRG